MNELDPLLQGCPGDIGRLIADKAYDSGPLRDGLAERGTEAVIPARSNWINPPPHDKQAYKARHVVENSFADLKHFRGIATRYCKLKATFVALLQLCLWHLATKPRQRPRSPYLDTESDSEGTLPEPTPAKAKHRQGRLWQRE